ncbi:MAG: hypothetical protein KDA99_04705, partial [Planctomycetales bacterium]|nr:hypothetical protein [Planctomycetales bacterium]
MRGSTQGVLVQNNAGDLVMADRSEIEGEVEAEVVETFSRPITPEPCIRDLSLCPYCESPLENAVQLAETLYRCPNDACSRLLYLDDAPQAPVTWS